MAHPTAAMIKVAANWLLAANLLIWCSAYAWAENVDSDKAEYLSHCAECHGLDGKGNGPRASKLKAKPSDLTLFEKRIKVCFRSLRFIHRLMDGMRLTSHDTDDMPIWGCRHSPSVHCPHTTPTKPKAFKPNAPRVFKPDPYRVSS